MTRRDYLRKMGTGFGMLGFADLMQSATLNHAAPLAPKPPHFTPKAKRVIFLFLNGGPSSGMGRNYVHITQCMKV